MSPACDPIRLRLNLGRMIEIEIEMSVKQTGASPLNPEEKRVM